jgi:glutamyl/glutaminyl-tRNA synthetase
LPDYDPAILVWKNMAPEMVPQILTEAANAFSSIPDDKFNRATIEDVFNITLIGGRKKGEVFWPIRVALSGQESSPDPIDIMEVLGKTESLKRITVATEKSKKLN